jgi:hypothetical protein
LLDRRPLAHDRAALQNGHPLLESIRRFAGRIGIAVVPDLYDPWGDE